MIEVVRKSIKPIDCFLIGAGNRGAEVYGNYAHKHPWQYRFVGVADPNPLKRAAFVEQHGIVEAYSFDDWEKLIPLVQPQNLVFICSPDRAHYEQVLSFLDSGCTIVLEKPVVVTPEQCADLTERLSKHTSIIVCHVLRYTPFFSTIKKLLDHEKIGKLISINLQENIAWYHFAHSYVRGNWRNSSISSPSILAKSVHDLDILYWLCNAEAETVVSMGDLSWFKKENAPEDCPDFCLDNCPEARNCPWYAPDVYLTESADWPASVISDDKSFEARKIAIESGPYGRCVYRCDNDVMDHQDVLIRFKNGITASFSMNALTYDKSRLIHIRGSMAEIVGDLDSGVIEIRHFVDGTKEKITVKPTEGGHNGGDVGFMRDLARIMNPSGPVAKSITAINDSLEAHWIAFAAEASRKNCKFINMDEYKGYFKSRVSVKTI